MRDCIINKDILFNLKNIKYINTDTLAYLVASKIQYATYRTA